MSRPLKPDPVLTRTHRIEIIEQIDGAPVLVLNGRLIAGKPGRPEGRVMASYLVSEETLRAALG